VESSCGAPAAGGARSGGGEELSYTYLDPHKKLKVKPTVPDPKLLITDPDPQNEN